MLYLHEKRPNGVIFQHPIEEVLYYGRTRFQQVALVKTPAYGIALFLDGSLQVDGRFRAEYHRRMVGLAVAQFQAEIRLLHQRIVRPQEVSQPRVLIVGAGTGGMISEVLFRWPDAAVIELEIDATAYQIYRRYLPAWFKRVPAGHRPLFIDAIEYDYKAESFDMVFFDIDVATGPGAVASESLLRRIRASIRPGGCFVAQAGSLEPLGGKDGYLEALLSTFPEGKVVPWQDYFWRFFQWRA